jgi:hypothetical protein
MEQKCPFCKEPGAPTWFSAIGQVYACTSCSLPDGTPSSWAGLPWCKEAPHTLTATEPH